MSRVFVTGVAGFLGSHIADAMLANGHEVMGIDSLIGGDKDNVPGGVMWSEGDCNDFELMKLGMRGCDLVYHCAATAYEGLSVFSPALVNQNIMGAATTTFSAAIACGVRRIVHCSSMARYGALNPPFRESDITMPCDPYGISKVAAETMLKNLARIHDIEYVIAVPHNIIGPRQKYDDPFRNVASIMINLALQDRNLIIYGDGNQQRCFSFIDDCLQCLVKMGEVGRYHGEIINIGPDEESVTINELAHRIMQITGLKKEPIYMPGRPQEVKVALCSSDKARAYLNYKTTTSLNAGLAAMVEYIRKKGPKKFVYHLPIEITSAKTPATWTDRLF